MPKLALCLLASCSFALEQKSPKTSEWCMPSRLPALFDLELPGIAIALDVRLAFCKSGRGDGSTCMGEALEGLYLSAVALPFAISALYGALKQHC